MISAIILSMNNDDTLEVCLRSVVDSLPFNKEIIIVDAHSTDNTVDILEKYKDKIKVVYDEGKGLGWARNIGVKNASNGIVAFVDPDVICAKDHFLKILNYFNEHPEIGALDTAGFNPQVGTKVQKLESLFWETATKQGYHQHSLRGWSIAFRRSAFDSVGGFCRGGSDDNDFTYRLKAKNIKTASIPIDSWHMPRRTLLEILNEMRMWAKNGALLYHEWGNNPVFIKDQSHRKLFRILHSAKAMVFVAHLCAPIAGIKYLLKSKSVFLYVYYIVRQYAWLLGYIQGNIEISLGRRNHFD